MKVTGSVRKIQQRAFSLIEVTMALAIFSFAILGLIGLLPVAITAHQKAKVFTTLAQINQRMASEVLLTEGTELAALDGVVRVFDYQGQELDDPDAPRVVYRAKIMLTTSQLPGATVSSSSLQRIELYAVQDPLGTLITSTSLEPSTSLLVSRTESAQAPTP